MPNKTVLDPERDLVRDDVKSSMKWLDVNNGLFDYDHKRPLPSSTAQEALKYIEAITKKYPFQIRYAMAKPLWDRFAEAWCETGDISVSMNKI